MDGTVNFVLFVFRCFVFLMLAADPQLFVLNTRRSDDVRQPILRACQSCDNEWREDRSRLRFSITGRMWTMLAVSEGDELKFRE